MDLSSWSGIVAHPTIVWSPGNRHELDAVKTSWAGLGSVGVVHGGGRSYSDVALPAEGSAVLKTSDMRHVISFDRRLGIVEVEAGVTLSNIQLV